MLFADITSSGSSGPRAVGSPCHQNDSGLLSEKHMSRSSQREGRKIFCLKMKIKNHRLCLIISRRDQSIVVKSCVFVSVTFKRIVLL